MCRCGACSCELAGNAFNNDIPKYIGMEPGESGGLSSRAKGGLGTTQRVGGRAGQETRMVTWHSG